jgi:hypothetical protein
MNGLSPDAAHRAAHAFARALLSPEGAEQATEAAIAAVPGEDPKDLRTAVRRQSFALLPEPPARPLYRRAQAGLRCSAAREGLLARAEGHSHAQHRRLAGHLAVCDHCRALSASLATAERAFADVVERERSDLGAAPSHCRWLGAAVGTDALPPGPDPVATHEWAAPAAVPAAPEAKGATAAGSWRPAAVEARTAAAERPPPRPTAEWVPPAHPALEPTGSGAPVESLGRRRRRGRRGRLVALAAAILALAAAGTYALLGQEESPVGGGPPESSASSLPTPLHR